MTFIEFIKKYAPSVKLDRNTSRIADITAMECTTLLGAQESVYGLTPTERGELCRCITMLTDMIQKSQTTSFPKSEHETISELYDRTKNSVMMAERREGR